MASKRNACYGANDVPRSDNFKPLNDKYGHVVGDMLLIDVADRLKNVCVRLTPWLASVATNS